ncbi:YggS family pyridoxal phosphate-dependent enzyme [Candidatus Dependentiae bacterium]|nr:YggS family pyridoxal phosphate-dependent enzyme [Candidatus Dependentiae bacterium]
MSIRDNYLIIRNEIPDDVTIVAAAKTRTVEEVKEIIQAGATDIGENYLQEAEQMCEALGEITKQVRWHMIGNLQKNKINKALPLFNIIQTVDSLKHAEDINLRAERINKIISVLIEVNIGSEITKSGVAPDFEVIENLAQGISNLKFLKLEGLMTMGPISGDPEEVRPYFRKIKQIFVKIGDLNINNIEMKTLSMGMSNSYKVAIQEGSNMIRLGTILFGRR